MISFKKWYENLNTINNDLVDDSQINRIYDKAKIAVDIVRMYGKQTNKKILNNISTIANLASGAYGLYNSKFNKKILSKSAEEKIRFKFGDKVFANNNLHKIPEIVIRKYIPEIKDEEIIPSDVIFVNVSRIVRESKGDWSIILQIASTIIHESTHEKEREEKGFTSESLPEMEEKIFLNWFNKNKQNIIKKYPNIK